MARGAQIGHKQTCTCYIEGQCVGGLNPGRACTPASESITCAGTPMGYCSPGGGASRAEPPHLLDTPRPSPRTNWTRRVPNPVLIGHAAPRAALPGMLCMRFLIPSPLTPSLASAPGVIPLEGGSSPLLYGDCECRAATDVEWASERWDGGELLNETVRAAQLNRTAGPGVLVELPPRTKWTRRVLHPILIGHVASLR